MGIQDNVEIKMSADAGAAQTALDRIADGLDKIASKGAKAGGSVDGMFGNIMGGVDSLTGKLTGLLSAGALLSKIQQEFVANYERVIAMEKRSTDSQIEWATAERMIGRSLDPDEMKLSVASQRIRDFAAGHGGGAAGMGLAVVGALSGKGDLSADTAISAVEYAKTVRPDMDSSGLNVMAQGILSIQKSIPGTSTKQAGAVFQNTFLAARAVNMEALAENIIPAIAQGRAVMGDTDKFEDIASLVLGTGQRADDPTGRKTGTNTIKFLEQLKIHAMGAGMSQDANFVDMKKFLSGTDKGMAVVKDLLGPFAKGGDASPEFLEDMKDKMGLHAEAKFLVGDVEFLQSLLGVKTRTGDLIDNARKQVGGINDAGVAAAQRRQDQIDDSPFSAVVKLKEGEAGSLENFALNGGNATAIAGKVRDIIEKAQTNTNLGGILDWTGLGAAEKWMQRGRFDADIDGVSDPGTIVEAGRQRLQATQRSMDRTGTNSKAQYEMLQNQIELLQDIRDKLSNQKMTITGGGETVPARVEASKAGQ